MSSAKKAFPSELECLISQMSRDLGLSLRALEKLRNSGDLSGNDRGLVLQLLWDVAATQYNVARVYGLASRTHLVNEPPEA